MWASSRKDNICFSRFVGLLVDFFRFSEGGGAGGMIEIGRVPSDSGERDFITNQEAVFLQVGRDALDDTRMGVMGSRLLFGFLAFLV